MQQACLNYYGFVGRHTPRAFKPPRVNYRRVNRLSDSKPAELYGLIKYIGAFFREASMNIGQIWNRVEKKLDDLEQGRGPLDKNMSEVQKEILILLDLPPNDVLKQIKTSSSPRKALITRLIYEAGKVNGIDFNRKKAINECLNDFMAEKTKPGQNPVNRSRDNIS